MNAALLGEQPQFLNHWAFASVGPLLTGAAAYAAYRTKSSPLTISRAGSQDERSPCLRARP